MTLCPEKQDWLLQGEPQIQSSRGRGRGTPGSEFREAAGLSNSPSTFNLLYLSTAAAACFCKTRRTTNNPHKVQFSRLA